VHAEFWKCTLLKMEENRSWLRIMYYVMLHCSVFCCVVLCQCVLYYFISYYIIFYIMICFGTSGISWVKSGIRYSSRPTWMFQGTQLPNICFIIREIFSQLPHY
jgi:hypothetical protein